MNRQAGYTLLELLVVLTIMGLLISALPGMALPGVTSIRFSGKIQEITSRLSTAHEKAIETGQTIALHSMDLAPGGVQVLLSPRSAEVTFFPDGSASAGTITVERGGHQQKLMIDAITGNVNRS